jgi:hypothetical protein
MLIKINSDYIHSIDQDYKGSQKYHKGEEVKVGNPDSKYYGAEGIWQGIAETSYDVYHYIEVKERGCKNASTNISLYQQKIG